MKLFSQLQRSGKKPDVLGYELPVGLRTQIVQIWEKGFGEEAPWIPGPTMAYTEIERILCEEHQMFQLPSVSRRNLPLKGFIAEYFLNIETEKALDVVQVVFSTMEKMLHKVTTGLGMGRMDAFNSPFQSHEMIEELNGRFRQNNVGYQYHQGQIIKLDGQFIHAEITVPAFQVLKQPYLKSADNEFLAAHNHFRHGQWAACINECLKAFESTMKLICAKRGWPFNQNDTARPLIQTCIRNGLISDFMENSLLGLATVRNRTSGHGSGPAPIPPTEDTARYALSLTATNVRLLADSEAKLK